MLVLIEEDWLTAKDKQGRTRLEMDGHYVRMEIEAGLKRDIPITPVLLQGAQIPSPEELPEAIRSLASRGHSKRARSPISLTKVTATTKSTTFNA
jgi:hypothetical protein